MVTRRTPVAHLMVAVSFFASAAVVHADEVGVYSTREANLIEPVIASFTQTNGVKVKLEFLVTPAAQRVYATAELESPVLSGVDRAPILLFAVP